MRINKYLSQAGVCSRREADRLIKEKRVSINGEICGLGDAVKETDRVICDGIPVVPEDVSKERVILCYNKPPGLICSTSNIDGETVFDRIDYPKRLFYAGRLDKASRGLLILTDDGDLANRLMKSKNGHEREYIVTCDTKVSDEMIKAFRKGVYIPDLEVKTRPCFVKRTDEKEFSIVLTQGLNRQIRRMCELYGVHVTDLCRVRVENVLLGKLKEGTYRRIKGEERLELLRSVGYGC